MTTKYVTKASGEREPFSFQKVLDSLLRTGASEPAARQIAGQVQKEVYNGMKTSEIFAKAKRLLKHQSRQSALRFNLKRAMKELGPTGFPFEKYVGEILKSLGFKTKINQYISGACVSDYEIDFVAEKPDLVLVGECKYRNLFSEKVDLKDALANYARFLDIMDGRYFQDEKDRKIKTKTILVSNGKFTQKAIDYSLCKGVDLLGWKFPHNKGLEYLAEQYKLYPITILSSLRGYVKKVFVENKLMLVRDVLGENAQKLAQKTGLREKELLPLIREAQLLLESK